MKNILFLLLPKKNVVFLNENCSLKFALEVMESNGYSAIPLISDKGKYVGALREGDLLWWFKNHPDATFENCGKYDLKDITLQKKVKPVRVNEPLEDIIKMAKKQNFIPVTDDNDIFIGIIRRQDVIDYLVNTVENMEKEYRLYEM